MQQHTKWQIDNEVLPNGNTRRGWTGERLRYSDGAWGPPIRARTRLVCTITRRLFDTLIGFCMKNWNATSRHLFNSLVLPSSFQFLPPFTPFRSFTHQHSTPSHMCKKHQDQLLNVHAHVHPPFPSFAWVMTAQANPPTPAYAYGYVQNVHAHRTRIPAHRTAPPRRHRPYLRPLRPLPLPARAEVEAQDGKFMVS